MRKPIALAMVFFFLFGCASATLIKSNPPGAKLLLDGQVQGETPYTYSDRAAAGTMRTVTLTKEGYKDFNGTIKREQLSVGALIGGIFFLIPLIWVLEYPSQYNFEMEKMQ
jgi:hypothetical protein